METTLNETAFEITIASALCEHGYELGNAKNFDRAFAFDVPTLLRFVQNSQPKAWKKQIARYGEAAGTEFVKNLDKAIRDQGGLLKIFREGFKDCGNKFSLCFFVPEDNLNPETQHLAGTNIFTVTRQVHYSLSSENSVDLVLFLNGVPVVTMELKNQFTGQDCGDAVSQYRFDRSAKDKLFEFNQRAFVHFAVDLQQVFMTTRLAGAGTRFLPFNQGSNGAGNEGGAGNPVGENGKHATAYLWERVLEPKMLLKIIQRYLHLKRVPAKKNARGNAKKSPLREENAEMIFPRFHQLHVVESLLNAVRRNGSGTNYLIQHSAGSGKSNSIAWLAHQLSGLHGNATCGNDEKPVFNSVIVLTDRKVLDAQLQETISQFEHPKGLIARVREGSNQLRDEINAGTKIIVSTLQKFPFIFNEVKSRRRKFAVIVDEAHSSQSGRAATTVIAGLSDLKEALDEYAQNEEAAAEKLEKERELIYELASQGKHKNLSFFAFTATPKAKTLERFGVKQADGKFRAHHIYSMRQAIEEGFILDVLQNYTTYQRYSLLTKKIVDDPEMQTKAAQRAVTRFLELHPTNISQKTKIMLEHFCRVTQTKIGGNAKAMVVASSRLQAMKYFFEFKKQIAENHLQNVDVLVAFSGELRDAGTDEIFCEATLNKTRDGNAIRSEQIPEYFHGNDFNILVVADKYQTGFDEKLLHTMFVDKKLRDVKAVQTLSRLNRTMPGKVDTFVLDFVNKDEDIQSAFQPFYMATQLKNASDPNELYKLKVKLDDAKIYEQNEVEALAKIYYNERAQESKIGAKIANILKPAIERWREKDEDERNEFRSVLRNFLNFYGFISQIERLFDEELQKFFVYAKLLATFLKNHGENIDLDDKLILSNFKLVKTFTGTIALGNNNGEVVPASGGTATTGTKIEPLSEIIKKFNERFGTNYQGQDVLLAQTLEDLGKQKTLTKAAFDNDTTRYNGLFDRHFQQSIISRQASNNAFVDDVCNDAEKLEFLKNAVSELFFSRIATQRQEKKIPAGTSYSRK